MKNESFPEIRHAFEEVRQQMISLIDRNISPDINNRHSTLSSNALATALAHAALEIPSETTNHWIKLNAQGMNIAGIPTSFSESSPFMFTCFLILEKMCGVCLPPQLREKIPPVKDIASQLIYHYSQNETYAIPLHLACVALLCTMEGIEMPQILQMISDLQQQDGSWTDDTIITALSAIALQKGGIKPKYNVQNSLERERLPDGSWAVANGEVWEASYALRTGEFPNASRLIDTLKECMHPNSWWGFSRYAVPDTDCTAVACYALSPYEPQIASTACENLLSVQHETGGWGAFPQIEGTVPHESVIGKPRTLSNDVTCHVLEVLEQRKKSKSPFFKRGISYLLDTQEQDGRWKTTWWRSDIYATTEIALLMYRNGYTEPALHALDWLEKSCKERNLTIVELALIIKAFSEVPDYSDSLNKVIHQFLERYRSESLAATFDGVHFVGLIDYRVYRLSIIVSSLHSFLEKSMN